MTIPRNAEAFRGISLLAAIHINILELIQKE